MTETPPQPAFDPSAEVLRFVADRDVACPNCGYNVRNLTAPRCPECGVELELKLGASQVRLGLWLATLLPLVVVGGLGCMLWVVSLKRGLPSAEDFEQMPPLAYLFIAPPFTLIVLLQRRWFCRLSRFVQKCVAGISLTLFLMCVVWFFYELWR